MWIRFGTQASIRQGLDAQQFQPQAVQAVQDAVEVRLVFDLPGEDRKTLFGLHVHPLEGAGIPFAELASHHYAVASPCAICADHRSSSARLIPRSGVSTNRLGTGLRCISENSVRAKFAESPFHAPWCMAFSLLCFCIIDTIGTQAMGPALRS